MGAPTRSNLRATIAWAASTLIAIPIAGYAGTAIVGPVDDIVPALAGGAIVGALVGAAQAFGSSRRVGLPSWTLATSVGLAVGTLLGTLATGFGTTLPDLALRGLIAGTVIGFAQSLALPPRTRVRWIWVPAIAALTAIGWTVTTLAGIDVDQQFITFGASGALVYAVLSGLALLTLLPATGAGPRSTASLVAGR